MFHTASILLQSQQIDCKSAIDKFSNIVNSVISQLEEKQAWHAISIIYKQISNTDLRKDIVEDIINNSHYKKDNLTKNNFDEFLQEELDKLTINEQFCILRVLSANPIFFPPSNTNAL